MADVLQDLPIEASPLRFCEAISSAAGLNQWWTRTAAGEPEIGAANDLGGW